MKLICIRYVFSDEIQGFISSSEAKLDMALATLSYLGSPILNAEISDDELKNNLLSGKYRLLEYFASHWLKIVLPLARKSSDYPPSFSKALTQAAEGGRSHKFQGGKLGSTAAFFQNTVLQRNSPDAYAMLRSALSFHRNENILDWSLKTGSSKPAP